MIYIKNYVNDWYNIITPADAEGWVKSEHVTALPVSTSGVSRSGTGREVFSNIEAVATKYLGKNTYMAEMDQTALIVPVLHHTY